MPIPGLEIISQIQANNKLCKNITFKGIYNVLEDGPTMLSPSDVKRSKEIVNRIVVAAVLIPKFRK